MSTLTPLEKAKFYDAAELPSRLSEEKRKTLRAGILKVRQEYEDGHPSESRSHAVPLHHHAGSVPICGPPV